MFITGIGTATPPQRYTQAQCWEALRKSPLFGQLEKGAQATLQRVLMHKNGISTRSLALNAIENIFTTDSDTLHRHFVANAPPLASAAAASALRQAGVRPDEIDGVIISTCTGYLCPGLSSYVIERLGLRRNVIALDLVGQGCGAALPNLCAAEGLLAAGRCESVLSICVEICSAAFYLDDDPGVLVSACLFGDGAGAAVVTSRSNSGTRDIEWRATASLHDPDSRDALRFERKNGLLRNVLTPQVPRLAAQHAEIVLSGVLKEHGLTVRDINAWIMHAGGRKVIEAIEKKLGFTAAELNWSRSVLSEFGNVSSPFVYFVLQAALQGNAPGGWWWMSSFGAGFSCHGALLKVEAGPV